VKATVNSSGEAEREWRASLWFVMLSPLLGILLGFLVLVVFSE
jgi:hypothetical protein